MSEAQFKVIKPKVEFTDWYNLEVQVWLDPGTHKTASRLGSLLLLQGMMLTAP